MYRAYNNVYTKKHTPVSSKFRHSEMAVQVYHGSINSNSHPQTFRTPRTRTLCGPPRA